MKPEKYWQNEKWEKLKATFDPNSETWVSYLVVRSIGGPAMDEPHATHFYDLLAMGGSTDIRRFKIRLPESPQSDPLLKVTLVIPAITAREALLDSSVITVASLLETGYEADDLLFEDAHLAPEEELVEIYNRHEVADITEARFSYADVARPIFLEARASVGQLEHTLDSLIVH